MNIPSPRWAVICSIGSYIILGLLVFLSLQYSLFQDFILYYLIVGFLLIIRDVISLSGLPKGVPYACVDWRKLFSDRSVGLLNMTDISIIFNRTYIFPGVLNIYILFLLLKQLDIFGLMDILSANPQVEWWILGFVAVSGFSTIFRESLDARYTRLVTDYSRTRRSLFVMLILSLLAVVIVFRETNSLGLLSILMSLISGLLIFLVGVMLLEEHGK